VLALIDTDSDPDEVDIAIPGNDDAMRAIELILKEIGDAVIEGKSGRQQGREDKGDDNNQRSGRSDRPRGRRQTTSAQAESDVAAAEKPQPVETPADTTPAATV
jgi:small subunit ribosomal protein S2